MVREASQKPTVQQTSPFPSRPLPTVEVVAASLGVERTCIERVARLTPMQRDLYLNHLMSTDLSSFSISLLTELGAEVDVDLWQRAITLVIEQESILRTVFLDYQGKLLQIALKGVVPEFTFIDCLETGEDSSTLVNGIIRAQYDLLSVQPAFRNFLLRKQSGEYLSVVISHHILCDGPASRMFINRVGRVYEALLEGRVPQFAEQKSFYDCVEEMSARFDTEDALNYWSIKLQEAVPLPVYKSSLPPATVLSSVLLRGEQLRQIQDFCAGQGFSLPTYFRLLYCILLSKYYNVQDDFVIYSVINGRPEGYQAALGCFYQVLPVIISGKATSPDLWFTQLLTQVRNYRKIPQNRQCVSTFALNQFLKDETVRYYYNFYNFGDIHFLGKNHANTDNDYYEANEVHLAVNNQEDQLELQLFYDQSKFTDTHFLDRLLFVSRQIIKGMRSPYELSVLLPEEEEQLLGTGQTAQRQYAHLDSFARTFQAQVERTPDAIAVSDGEQEVSYQQLNARANLLARHLQARGIGAESLVALLAERSIDFLVTILATFKAGGVYFPLNPSSPVAQITQILKQSQAALVLVSEAFLSTTWQALQEIPVEQRPPLCLLSDLWHEEANTEDSGQPPVAPEANHLAYIIYTSGSTGVPKGVMIEQRGLLNHLFGKISELGIGEMDTIAQTASQAFDVSVWQWLAGLLVGARVQVIADQVAHDLPLLLKVIERYQVTILEVVPSLIQGMFSEFSALTNAFPALSSLRWCLSTGEALTPELARVWLNAYPQIPLVNAYGPTECSDDVTHHFLSQPPVENVLHIPIGQVLANIRAYVLDESMNLVPPGVPGELYVGGLCVGRGYLHEAAKTAELFLPDPFYSEPGGRMYKTGDSVRILSDGSLEYLGRNDYQVKVRGLRIELGEIESCIQKYAAVREAVVVAHELAPGDKRLVAYLVTHTAMPFEINHLRSWMREWVPEYSIPSAFVVLERFPLSVNGKVERKALPLPDWNALQREEFDIYAYAASSQTEKNLVAIWSQALGVRQVSIHDDFFALGGNSLLALQIVSRIRTTFSGDISLRDFLTLSTIARLAAFVDASIPVKE